MASDTPEQERLRQEAAGWLARLRGPASDADHAAFARWYAEPAHAEAYDRMEAGFRAAGLLAASDLARDRERLSPQPRAWTGRYAMAAGLAALVAIPAAVLLVRPDALFAPARADTLLFATAVGEVREVPLPDGTRMTLDTRTDVRVQMRPDERRVTIEAGRARFAVAAEKRPFRVEAGRLRVSADAATFDVSVRPAAASVRAIAGRVTVSQVGDGAGAGPGPAPARLDPGESVATSPSGERIGPELAGGLQPSWPDGMLQFDNTPLAAAVAEANRYGRTPIVLADPSLASLRVSGTFRAGDLDNFARSLAAAFDLEFERKPGRVLLRTRSAAPALPRRK